MFKEAIKALVVHLIKAMAGESKEALGKASVGMFSE